MPGKGRSDPKKMSLKAKVFDAGNMETYEPLEFIK